MSDDNNPAPVDDVAGADIASGQNAASGDNSAGAGGDPTPAPASAVTTGSPEPEPKPAPNADGVWAESWREAYAGEDKAKLSVLQRYASPKAVMDALFSARETISKAAHKQQLPKDATPEQIAEYRKANGIGESPEKYLENLPEGVVFGDAEKPYIEPFLKEMHDLNAHPSLVQKALQSYVAVQERQKQEIAENDLAATEQAQTELKAEYGPEYKRNMTVVNEFVEANFPQDVKALFLQSRLGDDKGTPLFADARVIRSLVQVARSLNPLGTPTGGQGMDNMGAIETQLQSYEKQMKSDYRGWMSDSNSKAREHHLELLRAQERYKPKTS